MKSCRRRASVGSRTGRSGNNRPSYLKRVSDKTKKVGSNIRFHKDQAITGLAAQSALTL